MENIIFAATCLLSTILHYMNRTVFSKRTLIFWIATTSQFMAFGLIQTVTTNLAWEALIGNGIIWLWINHTMLKILYQFCHLDFNSRRYLGFAIAGVSVGAALLFQEFSFFAVSMVVTYSVALPTLYLILRVLFYGKKETHLITLLSVLHVLALFHLMDYPFLRTVEWFAPYGFTIHTAIHVGFAILLPSMLLRQSMAKHTVQLKQMTDILESTTDLVAMVRPDRKISYLNHSGKKLLGLTDDHDVENQDMSEMHPEWVLKMIKEQGIPQSIANGSWTGETAIKTSNGKEIPVSQVIIAHKGQDGELKFVSTIMRDITESKLYEEELEKRIRQRTKELEKIHQEKVEISRQAGMAEIASGVLHNVGNILNSVNVGVDQLSELQSGSFGKQLNKILPLLDEHKEDLSTFFIDDKRGQLIPSFFLELAHTGVEENDQMEQETKLLKKNVESIKNIIAVQQIAAGNKLLVDNVLINETIEQAITINIAGIERHKVNLVETIEKNLIVETDRLKIMQILINLVSNAKYAVKNSDEKRITIIAKQDGENAVVSVADTGEGISLDRINKIFQYGYTTKQEGHGFGLHNSALAAKDVGAVLQVDSPGIGKGAIFTLVIPKKYKGHR